MARYDVKPLKGKIGKARQVASFVVATKARPGDLDAIEQALVLHSVKYAGRKRGVTASVSIDGPTGHYVANLWCGEDLLATFDIDTIEE